VVFDVERVVRLPASLPWDAFKSGVIRHVFLFLSWLFGTRGLGPDWWGRDPGFRSPNSVDCNEGRRGFARLPLTEVSEKAGAGFQ
jgi:hypothetical protein